MAGMRIELENNLVKLLNVDDQKSEVKKHLAGEYQKLTERTTPEFNRRFETESESLRVHYLTLNSKDRRSSKPSLRPEKLSSPRLTESVRHSGCSFMRKLHWQSATTPFSGNRG